MTRGSCLCGAVRYELDGEFDLMLHCHCSMCRKHHGAPFATFASAPYAGFRWLAGEDCVAQYRSSEQGRRSFCRVCGSVGPLLMPEHGFAIVPAGNLLEDPGVRPQSHTFVGSKAPWYTIPDALPQHEGYPPEFGGGSGIERPSAESPPGVTAGSCLCGDVAFELEEPLRMVNCHCSRCRRQRSAAHTTNVFASLETFRWTRGESQVAAYKVPDAKYFTATFCKRCGGKAPRVAPDRGFAVIPAGVLDTDPGMRPQAHIFVGSKASWFEITDSIPRFDAAPPA